MSFIPMVSSSPPPMDDGWADGDDFGDFASADSVVSTTSCSLDTTVAVDGGTSKETQYWASKNGNEHNHQNEFNTSEDGNVASIKHGCNHSSSEREDIEGDNWADFKSSQVTECEDTCTCGTESCECEKDAVHLDNVINSNTGTNHSSSKSNKMCSSSIQDSTSRKEQCDTISQGSLTDSGMYSNDISPAPKTGDSLNFEVQFSCDEKADDSGSRSQFANPDERLSSSSDSSEGMCSSETSQTNGSVVKEETVTDLESVEQTDSSREQSPKFKHKQHEESPEPLDFKPASFSEEEGKYFQHTDFDEGFNQFYDDDDDKNIVDSSEKDSDEPSVCDKNLTSFPGNKSDTGDSSSNKSGQASDEGDSESETTVQVATFHEQNTGANVLSSESTQESNGYLTESNTDMIDNNETINEASSDTIVEESSIDTVLERGSKCTDDSQSSECGDSNNKVPHTCSTIGTISSSSDPSLDQTNAHVPNAAECDSIKQTSSNNSIEDADERHSTCEKDEDFEFEDFSSADIKPVENDGGWCAFDSGTTVEDNAEEEDDWAAFSEPSLPRFELKDDDSDYTEDKEDKEREDSHFGKDQSEDDFGNFEGQNTEEDFGDFSSETEQVSVTKASPSGVGDTLRSCFPEVNGNEGGYVFVEQHMLDSVAEENVTGYTVITNTGHQHTESDIEVDMNLWNYLKDMENARGIKFTWNNSNAMNMLLKAVNIDGHSLEPKKPAMPVFASSLGAVLKPSNPSEAFSRQGAADPPSHQSKNIIVDMDRPSHTTSGNSSQELPAVDFDWKTSGLTNPLDAHSTVPLDLDFFVDNDKGSSGISKEKNVSLLVQEGIQFPTYKSKAQQNEQAILQSLEPLNRPVRRKKIVQPLEHILASMKFIPTLSSNTLKSPEQSKKLSPAATEIVDKLRDFSFMKAQVLMFPMAENNSEEQVSMETDGVKDGVGREEEEKGSGGGYSGSREDVVMSTVDSGEPKETETSSANDTGDWLAEAEITYQGIDGEVKEMF